LVALNSERGPRVSFSVDFTYTYADINQLNQSHDSCVDSMNQGTLIGPYITDHVDDLNAILIVGLSRTLALGMCYGTVGAVGNSNSIENSMSIRPSYVA
jgi:hypothetical protein